MITKVFQPSSASNSSCLKVLTNCSRPIVLIIFFAAIAHFPRFTISFSINMAFNNEPQCSNSILMLPAEVNIQHENLPVGRLSMAILPKGGGAGANTSETTTADHESYTNVTVYMQQLTMMLNESNDSFGGSPAPSSKLVNDAKRSVTTMHVIEYVALEHNYPVSNVYQFGIPEITQECKCDCSGGQQKACKIEEYMYKNCSHPNAALCYRTYNPNQQNTGCITSGKSELCCEILLNPHKSWVFQAIRLRQPSTVAVIRYRILERLPGRRAWTNIVDQLINLVLNKGAMKFDLNSANQDQLNSKLQIAAFGGRPHRQVEPGLYYFRMAGETVDSGAGERLRSAGVSLNEQIGGDLEKLGWFRRDRASGVWSVKKGLEKITQAQHVDVFDCMAQQFRATVNAMHVALKGNGEIQSELDNWELGTLVKDEQWVHAVKVEDRSVKVIHSEGVALTLNIRTESKPQIVHQSSYFSNFSGSIILDSQSRPYLNLTFQNARGTLVGHVFSSPDSLSAMEALFSVEATKQTPEFRQIVALPSSVNSPRLVCFHPLGDMEGRICHRLDYVCERLDESREPADYWMSGQTNCNGCNERGFEGLLLGLDPRNWLDGLNTPTETVTCILEVVSCFACLLLAIVIITKCVFPLFKCVFILTKPAKNKISR